MWQQLRSRLLTNATVALALRSQPSDRCMRVASAIGFGAALGGVALCGRSRRGPTHMEDAVPVPRGRSGWVPRPLLGKVAVVTGSSQGIGAGIAMELAHAGADVCINYVGDVAPARQLAQQITKLGRQAVLVEGDVADRSSVERMFDQTEQKLGPVSILVTNAVTSRRQNILETRPEDFERTLKIGLYGVLHCMQIFSQRAVAAERRGGSIVHIGSPHAKAPFKDAIDYNVAKAGSQMLALSVANELMWTGTRVNVVQPGWTYTEGELRLYSKETLDKAGAKMPLGRLCMPEDIGKAVVWLSSDEASYVTGTTLTVDGGQFIETAPSWESSGRHTS